MKQFLDNLLTKIFKIRNQGKKLVDFYRSMLINSSHNHRSLMLQLKSTIREDLNISAERGMLSPL